MEHSRDALRRALRGIDRENDAAVDAHAQLIEAVFERDPASSQAERAEIAVGSLLSRRVLTIGGLSAATAAVVAACGGGTVGKTPVEGAVPTSTTAPRRTVSDVVLLRTASSLEHNAISIYDTVGGDLSGDAASAAKLFAEHHRQHAALMEKTTKDLGGSPFTTRNPIVAANVVDPNVAKARTEGPDAIVRFAHAFESVVAHSYQLLVPALSQPSLRKAAMSIGAVEARHATILANVLGAKPVSGIDKLLPPATTTTLAANAVVAPEVFQVPGAFEPLTASSLVLDGALVTIEALGPNSYAYDYLTG